MSVLDRIAKLFGIVGSETTDVQQDKDIDENGLMISVDDFKKLTQKTYVQQSGYRTYHTLMSYFITFFGKSYNETSAKIRDAKRLKKIFPELNGAENLLAAAILSPANFLNFNINFAIEDNSLTQDQKMALVKQISDFFKDEFDLPNKLYNWLVDIIGTTGSKPVMILPYTALQKLRESDILDIATENLKDASDTIAKNRIYGTDTQDVSFSVDAKFYSSLASALESIYNQESNNTNGLSLKPLDNVSSQLNNELIKYFKSRKIDNLIQFVEDPSVLVLSQYSTSIAMEKASKELNDYFTNPMQFGKTTRVSYKPKSFIDISAYVEPKKENYPIVIELPSEAVVPLITPGNPSEHIGYIVLLDQFGNPLTAQDDMDQQLSHYTRKDNYLIQKLYTTMYKGVNASTLSNPSQLTYSNILKQIYERYLSYLIATNLSNLGFQNVNVSFTNTALSTILSHILAGKKTRMLFVPEEFITYFAISFNDKGIGESKTEEIKFIAALRMTYIITRLFALMENSVNSRRLMITFDNAVSNPLELAKKMKQSIINERIFDFSYEPSDILKTLLEREINIIPRSLPGIENFSVEDEPKQRNVNRPDEDLIEQLNNMSLNGLEIPPSVFNQLRESEFSRSVLTNNIFFVLRTVRYQKKITAQLNKFVRTYLKYFTKFQQTLLENIPTEENKDISIDKVIQSIRVSLPPLKLGFDTNAGKILSEYTSTIDEAINQLFPDNAVPDDLRDNYDIYRSMFKAKLIKKFLQKVGLFEELDIDSLDVDADEVADFIRYLQNFSKGINDLVKTIGSEE